MVIKVFNHEYGGWYRVKVESIDDVYDLLEEGNQLPDEDEVDTNDLGYMHSLEDLEHRFAGMHRFDIETDGLGN